MSPNPNIELATHQLKKKDEDVGGALKITQLKGGTFADSDSSTLLRSPYNEGISNSILCRARKIQNLKQNFKYSIQDSESKHQPKGRIIRRSLCKNNQTSFNSNLNPSINSSVDLNRQPPFGQFTSPARQPHTEKKAKV